MSTGPRYWNEETQRWEDTAPGTPGTDGGTPPSAGEATAPAAAWPAPADSGPASGAPGGGADGETPSGAAGSDAGGPAGADRDSSGSGQPAAQAPAGPGPGGHAGGPDAIAPAGGSTPAVPPPPPHPDPHAAHSLPTLTGIQPPPPAPGPGPAPGPAPWPAPEPSYPYPPVAPTPGSSTTQRRLWAVVGGAAVVGVAAGLVVTFAAKDGDGSGGRAQGNGSVSAGASQTPGPSSSTGEPRTPTVSPSALASDLPAGFESYDDPQGFRIARPAGWTRTTVASKYGMDVVHYRSPDGEQRIQVFEVAEPSPEDSHELFLSDAVPKAPGFTELSLENLDDGDFTGSRLEYLVDSIKGEPDVGTWHVVDQRFMAADGKLYAIAAYGADADGRDGERELLRTALSGFCPPGTVCGTGGSQP